MAHYADQIATLALIQQLRSSKGRDDVTAPDVELLVGMVMNTADTLGPLLDRIPLTFRQYTQHDLRHSANIIRLMGKFIPKRTLKQLNAVELAILALSAIVHDAGMFVRDDEREAVVASPEYRRFEAGQGERATLLERARAKGEHQRAAALQDALLAEYFRRLHPERAAGVVKEHLAGKLTFREIDLAPVVLRIAESHGWGVLESNDPRDPDRSVSRLSTRRPVSSVPVNEQYLACCLRLADIMDFDRSRTPAPVFQHLEFTEQKSWEEWNKHLQVQGWHMDEHEVMYSIPCSHPAFYMAVMEFLDWIDAELRDCRHLVKEAPRNIADRYELNLPPVVDRWQVEMEDRSYLAGAFRFQLDYERIMQLLMDRSLYPDSSLFLRELLQNSLDACRTREAHAKERNAAYAARIVVWDHSDDPEHPRIVFQDNGIGMSRHIVENYFMRVGRSYYKSAEFEVERQRLGEQGVVLEATSQFGIGILSCFMVADRFEVETYRVGNRPLHITIEGATKYFTIRMLPEPPRADFAAQPAADAEDGPPNLPGTRVTVHLKSRRKLNSAFVLKQFAVNIDYDLLVHQDGFPSPFVIPAWRWRKGPRTPSADRVMIKRLANRLERADRGIDMGAVGAVLDSILVPVHVPLRSYDSDVRLDGHACFWLLRGPMGEPCPARGYLKVGAGLRCTGNAALAGELMRYLRTGALVIDWMKLSAVAGGREGSTSPDFRLDPYFSYTDRQSISPDFWDRFSHAWDRLPPNERGDVARVLTHCIPTAGPWFENEETSEALLRGDLDSVHPFSYLGAAIERLPFSEQWAMHGISVPAGIVKWDTTKGHSNRQEVFDGVGTLAIDLRRTDVVLAANRLFINHTDASRIIVPVYRACIRFALTLAGEAAGDRLQWRTWVVESILPLIRSRWYTTLRDSEFAQIEQTQGYLCSLGEKQAVLSREKLLDHFGRRVPYGGVGVRDGIIPFDPLNLWLLAERQSVRLDNGRSAVDIESKL